MGYSSFSWFIIHFITYPSSLAAPSKCKSIYGELSPMTKQRGRLLLLAFFAAYQVYLHSYTGRIGLQYDDYSDFLRSNIDELSQYWFILAIFLALILYLYRIPLLQPEFRIRLGEKTVSYVVKESMIHGATIGSILFLFITVIALLFGLKITPTGYLVAVWARLATFSISIFMVYWAFYFWIGKESIALVCSLLMHWFFSIAFSLYSFYSSNNPFILHEARMTFFHIFEGLLIGLSALMVYIGARKEILT